MDTVGLLVALLLPWLVGVACVYGLWPSQPGRWPAILGYGYLVGYVGTTLVMRAWDAVGLTQQFWPLAATLGATAAVGFGLSSAVATRSPINSAHGEPIPGESRWAWAAVACLLAFILVRYGGYALEVVWRPLYPWDAWSRWADRARIWFAQKDLVSFEVGWRWLKHARADSFVGAGMSHPPTVSLVQTWTALGGGRWNDTVINLPWVGCAAALGLGLYGQALMIGIRRLPALLLIYVILSMPFLGTHVALAGYADLWLTTCYALASAALLRWIWQRDVRQGLLAVLLALACPLIKTDSGVLWMAVLLFAGLISVLGIKGLWVLTGLIIGMGVGAFVGVEFAIPGLGQADFSFKQIKMPGMGRIDLAYHGIWVEFWKHWARYANWHLGFYVLVLGIGVAIWQSRDASKAVATAILVAGGIFALILVFICTEHYTHAVEGTTINRAALPAFVIGLFGLAVWLQGNRMARSERDSARGSPVRELSRRLDTTPHLPRAPWRQQLPVLVKPQRTPF